jgi:hypothetical protein
MAQRLYNKPNPSNDAKLTGWYKTMNNNQVALRVGDNDLKLDGIIRFKKGSFEGYDGHTWISLNSNKGDKGDAGKNFSEVVNIETNQSKINPKTLKNVNQAEINMVTSVSPPDYKLELRNIVGGKGIELLQDNTTIMIQNKPQPYVSSLVNNSVSNLKSQCHGDITTYLVAPKYKIKKGEAVQIVNMNNKIYVKTVNYNNEYLNLFNSGINILGIALQNSNEGQSCQICTKGICNVLINNEAPFTSSLSIKVNDLGIVSKKGGILNASMKPLDNFISAGYFLENGEVGKNGNMVLFYVEPRIHYL